MGDTTQAVQLEAARGLFMAGHLDEAERQLTAIVEAEPNCGDALEGLAYIAARRANADLAADYFDRALASVSPTPSLYRDAGTVNQAAKRHSRAVVLFEQALALAPSEMATRLAMAQSLSELGEFARAAESLIAVRNAAPGMWQSHYNLGRALGLAGRYDEEIAAYRQAIALKPDAVQAYVNLGVALRDLHRFDEALKVFAKAVRIDQNDPAARTNRAQTNLLLGQFEHGWREYEWRWRDGGQTHPFGPRSWRGEVSLENKTLLLFSEQGHGDTLQFVRYVADVAALGARIVLRVQDPLVPLLKDYPGVAAVIGESGEVPAFDYHCPLLSLPFALAAHRASIPAFSVYLSADEALRGEWRARLGERTRALRVGIAWSGSRGHVNDRNRSISLDHWTGLFDTCRKTVQFVSLVKDVRDADRDALQASPLLDVSDMLGTFADTAALIAELDLVVCVDTAVAHLAGALGKPVWILLPFTPDWRWQLQRTDSPWYPSVKLFRQPERGNWAGVIDRVCDELLSFVA